MTNDQLKPSTPIDELLEKWKEQARTPNAGPAVRGIIYVIADELESAWTSTKAQMVAREEAEKLAEALEIFTECDLNDDNCASLEIASKRIRNMANRTLKAYRQSHPKPQNKTT